MAETNDMRQALYARRQINGTCWEWTGSIRMDGYGVVSFGAKGNRWRGGVHRLSYMLHVGPIPKGLTIDHLCKNRRCFNPAHLEVVTRGENSLRGDGPTAQNKRKTHCMRGHEFTEANTWTGKDGRRYCRTCRRDIAQRFYHSSESYRENKRQRDKGRFRDSKSRWRSFPPTRDTENV